MIYEVMMPLWLRDIWMEGEGAGLNGGDFRDCPYENGTVEVLVWQNGCLDGSQEY